MSSNNGDEKVFQTEGKSSPTFTSIELAMSNNPTETLREWTDKTKKLLKDGEDVPEIYKDPAYSYSSTWFISSSQLSSEYYNGYGWSQVVDDGWG